jgi:adenosylhomocysteine nucleosidase
MITQEENKTIGVMGAMPEEIAGVLELMTNVTEHEIGMRTYHQGKINNTNVVLVFSRWGKVAAASTVTTLINLFNINQLIFTGVAGAMCDEINIGDIVIGKKFFQHDMDARPFIEQFEIPMLDIDHFEADTNWVNDAFEKLNSAIENKLLYDNEHPTYTSILKNQKAHIGDIASGDQFISNESTRQNLIQHFPDLFCVEMEGAAVAQVCFEFNIPFITIRVISDGANSNAPIDFADFVKHVASKISKNIIKILIV